MKRLSGPWVMVAVLLAVLLPLEQAHCLVMPLQAHATASGPSGPRSADHSCCAPTPAAQPQHARQPAACLCFELPAGTVPTAVGTTPDVTPSEPVLLAASSLLAAPRAASAPLPAPDVGSPPLPIACDAHGLRAPPLSV